MLEEAELINIPRLIGRRKATPQLRTAAQAAASCPADFIIRQHNILTTSMLLFSSWSRITNWIKSTKRQEYTGRSGSRITIMTSKIDKTIARQQEKYNLTRFLSHLTNYPRT